MGWKGAVRSIQADMRRAAREAEKERKYEAKMQTLEDAENKVMAFEDYIEQITSIHDDLSSDFIDWEHLANKKPPKEPKYQNSNESEARYKHEHFKPNFLHKMLKSEGRKREKLKQAIEKAVTKDQEVHEKRVDEYQSALAEWKKVNTLAVRVVSKEPKSYLDVIKKYSPFTDIENLGSAVNFSLDDNGDIIAAINVHSDEVIPKEKQSLRQSGTLSTKNMPKGEFNELYQDHVCSCVLRVAGELFALLPIERLIVNANDDLLNSKTGHIEEQTILSVLIMRDTFEKLNLAQIDPSDSMGNFIHNMKFKKTSGFGIVDQVKYEDVEGWQTIYNV